MHLISYINLTELYCQMEQHYQVVNLHNIIKSQESKIHELREELRIANEREERRYGQFSEQSQIQNDEKDKLIQYLKEEIAKTKTERSQGILTERDRNEKEREKMERELIMCKKKCIELEGKVKRVENESSIKVESLVEQNLKMSLELQKFQESKNYLAIEVTKLNHFYKNSLFEIGKRKQTLLWVEKFTDYLENSEAKEKKTLADVNNFVKGEIQNLRTTLAHMVNEIAKSQSELMSTKNSSSEKISELIQRVKNECDEIYEQNERYWAAAIKASKQSEHAQQIQKLSKELSETKQKSGKQCEQMRAIIKTYENEKKTLILGFQQLKSLNEHRQSGYKQEIKILKDTVQGLIETGEQRDKEFEEEIKALSRQIEQISQRYYENIQYPARKLHEKTGEEFELFKTEMEKIHHNPILKASLSNFEGNMVKYLKKIQQSSNTSAQVEGYLSHSNQIIQNILQVMRNKKRAQIQSPSKQNSYGRHLNLSSDTINLEMQQELKQIEEREKINKSQYEAILAKRHLLKMQEYVQSLEKKIYPSTSKSNKNFEKQASKKIILLEAENEALKENLEFIKQQFHEDLNSIKSRVALKLVEWESTINQHQLLNSAVTKINETNAIIEKFVEEQREHCQRMKESAAIIESLLTRPLESFEAIVRDVASVSHNSRRTEPAFLETNRSGQTSQRPFKSTEEVRAYKQILLKRVQNHQNTQRLVAQMIKTLRQSQKESTNKSKHCDHSGAKKQEAEVALKTETKPKAIEKKIREVQSQRIKDRQQFISKLQKIEQDQAKINNKISRSVTLKSTLAKFEVNLDQKIDEIVKKMQLKLDKSQLAAIKEEVISDMRSKLHDANIENEGLRREISLLNGMKAAQIAHQ